MTTQANVPINSNPFNLGVIEEFRANGGIVGGVFDGVPLLLLTTRGAKTGASRTTPLVYLSDGGRVIVFAANGGAPKGPAWHHNLLTAGEAVVEIGEARYAARPEPVPEDEHERLWALQTGQDANFGEFRGRTDRTIPVISLVRQDTERAARLSRRSWPYSR